MYKLIILGLIIFSNGCLSTSFEHSGKGRAYINKKPFQKRLSLFKKEQTFILSEVHKRVLKGKIKYAKSPFASGLPPYYKYVWRYYHGQYKIVGNDIVFNILYQANKTDVYDKKERLLGTIPEPEINYENPIIIRGKVVVFNDKRLELKFEGNRCQAPTEIPNRLLKNYTPCSLSGRYIYNFLYLVDNNGFRVWKN